MIFYFSGTGNSRHVAQELGLRLNENLVEVGNALTRNEFNYTLKPAERLGFVFPTYSWGPAPVVLDLINKLEIKGYASDTFTFMVTTCGDDIGCSVNIFRKALSGKSWHLHAAYSIQMPNNYVNMKGFDVDSDNVRLKKLHAAPARIAQVAQMIAEKTITVDVVTGSWKWVKSHIIRPAFLRNAMSDKKFHVESDKCTHCSACVSNCPMHNITLNTSQEPEWNGRCAMCLGCLHHCPARAIQHGKATLNKGRYHFTSP